MTIYAPPKTEIRVPAPELRGAALALGSCQDREVCIEGSAGTGKTVGALFKIHVLLSRYPGARALVARKTNTALSGSAMVTYRDNILRGRRDIRWFGGSDWISLRRYSQVSLTMPTSMKLRNAK